MRKIPTVLVRDPEDMSRVLPEIAPGCEWVFRGEGVATRKYDGTCVMFDGEQWWTRREVKPGKLRPDGYVEIEQDPNTGKIMGWEPAEQSSFAQQLDEAIGVLFDGDEDYWRPGTYELCGPKINRNPEGYAMHTLVAHSSAERVPEMDEPPIDSRDWLPLMEGEGIVWHHPDGSMAKIKVRDIVRSDLLAGIHVHGGT